MSDRKESIRHYILDQHAHTWPILTGLGPEDFAVVVYDSDGGVWTVRDLLVHMADAERGVLGQARRLAAGKQTVPAGFDLDRWNATTVRKRKDTPVTELLEAILEAHVESLEFLDTVEEAQLDLEGRHSSGVVQPLEWFLRRIAEHRAEHTGDIAEALDR